MKKTFYKIECLTNLHVGSGDINYNIIDNEVEKDQTTNLPIIHASGIKGALRDAVEENIDQIFGTVGTDEQSGAGTHKFFDAHLISRPMRVRGSASIASIPVASVSSINQYLALLTAFGCNNYGLESVSITDFGDNEFLTNSNENISIEGVKTGKLSPEAEKQFSSLSNVLGDTFAMAKNFDDYALPVVARNSLGKNKNLWYEEVVPHGSVFYFVIISPDDDKLKIPEIVQFGGNASIGCGYCKVTKL